jgi:adenylosuccinate synthase
VVTPQGQRHVFKHFGSGTLLGVPTYLSQFFVCNPILFFEELRELNGMGIDPVVAAHPGCLITTHVDMLINQHKERARGVKRHGSTGVGLHETEQRSRVPELRLTFGDLLNGTDIADRLREISNRWSKFRTGEAFDPDGGIEAFVACGRAFARRVQPMGAANLKDPVLEGAQGLLLSQDNEAMRPHLTHSYTGMRNARIICTQAGLEPEPYYVSRTYLTRHGVGPLPGEGRLTRTVTDDTNFDNQWQGPLRFAQLDDDLRDRVAADAGGARSKLIFTHCDQLEPTATEYAMSYGPTREDVDAAVRA